ncbi:hypothetical protein C8Q73DRAFT_669870 [Cubamyces lactineus]|nr:hypothetical protein C8Q73DRAFT_669870 [Cubamyces lactineus]
MALVYRVGKRRVDGAHLFKIQQAKTERRPKYWRKYAQGEDEESKEERMREPGVAPGLRIDAPQAIHSVIGDDRRATANADFDTFIDALVEIGFKTIGGATNVGITLQPPLGLHGAELDLFVPWPTAMDGWWPHEYTPAANMLCNNYNIKAADFIKIPDDVDMVGIGFEIPGKNSSERVYGCIYVVFVAS